MSVVGEFENTLREIPTLKAPGISGSRIKKLTDIAVKNVHDESKLITTLYSNCKAVPSAYKLSTLYVVDSIVRVYVDEARKNNQEINASAPEGTYAAGVFRISELIESLVDDTLDLMISNSQRVKVGKLVDIWERAETFKPEIIQRIRTKHFASTTPPGSPPRISVEPVKPTNASNQSDSTSILLALASLAKSNSNSNTPNPAPAVTAEPPSNANNILSQLSALAGGNHNGNANNSNTMNNSKPAPPAAAGLPPVPQVRPQAGPPNGQNEQYIFKMLQQMQGNGASLPQIPHQNMHDSRRGRDDNASGYSRRNRSRSPNRFGQGGRRERSPPRQQGMNNFSPNQMQNQMQNQPQIPTSEMNMPGTPHYRPRNVGFDQSLPQGSFKVLSRTLFIGGVPRSMDEAELASVLRPYAEVQSVILNSERKHAFVKVYSRREAEQVITSFNKDNSLPLRTRWGVGFGPRDCCNYQHGISIIPIQRLTDADKSWVVQAQWGGTGGQPLLSGMVIDEPDIEIGAGISSKAMSKKMPTNSARNGPKSNKPGEPDEDYVKTTLIPQQAGPMSHGSQPDFTTMTQSSANPLFGLFNNNNGNMPSQPPQGMPNGIDYSQVANYMNGMQGNVPQANGLSNPNLGAQLTNFFQSGGMGQQ
ncbi:uncharacterized protein PRCAT00006028001 [Priceomyces carsonii]|uniref:uncharacterized protein n=1 Tax=Priceomyces carsonii TaxID=28549 RepID=UPI002EDB59B9|nr:unnamed protein product [Priceomyces carsonii]